MKNTLITVVTVVYNDVSHIASTIESTLSQTWKELEYIVVDGGSTDGTLDVIKKYEGRISWISEPDNGIYDAMMKGARMATGEWLLFRNSGDYFFNEKSIEDTFANYVDKGEALIAGGIRCFSEYGFKDSSPNILRKNYFDGVPFNHPATFIRRTVQLRYPFHLEYRNSADYCCFLEILTNGGTYYIAETMVARMDCSQGTTAEHYDRGFRDNIEILMRMGASKRYIDKQRSGLRRYQITAVLRRFKPFKVLHNRYRSWRQGYRKA